MTTGDLTPAPVIETERLVLRPFRAADIAAEQAFYETERSRFVGGPRPAHDTWRYMALHVGHWAIRGYGTFAVEERDTGLFCGHVGPWFPEDWPEPELSWTLMPEAEGRGIAFEAVTAMRRWVYDTLGWATVISLVADDNARSIALAQRLGAVREGTYAHPSYGPLALWRHPTPAALAEVG